MRGGALWIAVLAAGRGAVLGGGTALAEYGLHRYAGPGIHLLLPARAVSRAGCQPGWSCTVPVCCRGRALVAATVEYQDSLPAPT